MLTAWSVCNTGRKQYVLAERQSGRKSHGGMCLFTMQSSTAVTTATALPRWNGRQASRRSLLCQAEQLTTAIDVRIVEASAATEMHLTG